jgi:hypothetical protein
MTLLKNKVNGRNTQSANGAFLFRRNRRGAAVQQTEAVARVSRSKISDK